MKCRYNYDLPENQSSVKILETKNNKLSLIRDLCLKLGISLFHSEDKDFILDNDITVLRTKF